MVVQCRVGDRRMCANRTRKIEQRESNEGNNRVYVQTEGVESNARMQNERV